MKKTLFLLVLLPKFLLAQCDLELVGFDPISTALKIIVHDGHCGTPADSVGEFLLGITYDPPIPDNPFECMYENGWAQLIFPLNFPGFEIGQGADNILQSGDTITFLLTDVPFFGSGTAQCWMDAMDDGVYYEDACVVIAITQINDSDSFTGQPGLGGFPYPDENVWNNYLEFSLSEWNTLCAAPPPPYPTEIPPETDPCEDDIIYVPNAFTPNNDGKNDIFQPVLSGDCWLWYEFFVFNRWGKKVFESDYPGDIWRGDINTKWGQKPGKTYCADGVYFWIIRGQKRGDVWVELTGTVTLLR